MNRLDENGIVRIVSNRHIGTGFVVPKDKDGLIATCAHVLGLSRPEDKVPEKVMVVFQGSGERREAVVESWDAAEDIALLSVSGELPTGVCPLPLGSSLGTWDHSFTTFGYPETGEIEGIHGTGTISGQVMHTETRQPMLQLRSNDITKGFSGAPVWDEARRRVVGMVGMIVPEDTSGRMGDIAFATPTETLRGISPALQLDEICPYRGLAAFTEEDAGYFFGRQSYIEQLLKILRKGPRLLTIFGASGSGKSSLVRAGLIPRLRKGGKDALPGSDRWEICVKRPTDSSFKQDLAGLDRPSTRVIFVIDQFEDLFVSLDEKTSSELITQMEQLLENAQKVTLLIVIRVDFLGLLMKIKRKALEKRVLPSLFQVRSTLERVDVEDIVRKPAEGLGWQFGEELVNTIVGDVLATSAKGSEEDESGSILPLLESTLRQLWEQSQDGVLTLDAYRHIGGITGGLREWADNAYDTFERRLQPLVRRIFTGLVHLGDKELNIPDSRRRRVLSTLIHNNASDAEKADVRRIVDRLVAERLLVASDQEAVEIIHDALLWEWEPLKQWLKEEESRDFLLWHQDLEQRAKDWEDSKRKKEKLLQGEDLKQARRRQSEQQKYTYKYLNQGEVTFIQASQRLHDRRIALRFVGGVAIVAAFGSVLVPRLGQTAYQWVRAQFLPYRVLASFVADGRRVYCVAWSPSDAVRLASGGAAGLGHISSSAGQHIYTYRGHLLQSRPAGSPTISITAVTWSPDGFRVASGSSDGSVHVWNSDSTNPSPPFIYQQHSGLVHAVAWSPVAGSQSITSSAGFDTTVHVWNATTGQTLASYSKHTGPVNALAWSPDGAFIASGSGQLPGEPGENAVHIWRVANGETRWVLRGHSSHILTVAWSPDSRSIASGGWDHTVKIWSVQTGELLYTYTGHTNAPVNTVSWSPDSTYIVSAGNDGLVQVWRAQDGKQIYTYGEHTQAVNSVAWSPRAGDTRIVSASNDTTVQVWQQK
jgi:WD40 repeat protein